MILDENLRSEESPLISLTDAEIFTRIWTSPRIVFRFLNETHYDKHIYLLLMLGGISNGFEQATAHAFGENWPLIGVIVMALILGSILGLIANHMFAGLMLWTGKLFNGRATFQQILRVNAYSLIPAVSALVFVLFELIIYGESMFRRGFNVMAYSQSHIMLFYTGALAQAVLSIWGFVLNIAGISEVQKISTGAAIGNVVIPGIGIVLIVFVVMYSMNF